MQLAGKPLALFDRSLLLGHVKQARVFERDGDLGGEGGCQLSMPRCKRMRTCPGEAYEPENSFARRERDGEVRADALEGRRQRRSNSGAIFAGERLFAAHVTNDDRLAPAERLPDLAGPVGREP